LTENLDRYEVLISDIGMPEKEEYFLIREVPTLAQKAGREMPAAALTAYASDREQERAIKAGFETHIAKPIKLIQLGLIMANLAAQF
jgi:two-component system, chemotaxis family, CheB/CheR fusion protein